MCSAKGFPTPTYRWFKDNDDTLFEYDKKEINKNEDTNEAVLTLTANSSTFGKRFKCQATNDHGDSSKYFTILRMEKPKRPSEVINGKLKYGIFIIKLYVVEVMITLENNTKHE